MPKVSYSTIGFDRAPSDRGLDAALAAIAAAGFDALEPQADPYSPGQPGEQWRKEKVSLLGDCMRFAGQIGADGMVVHGVLHPCFLPARAHVAALVGPMEDAIRRSEDDASRPRFGENGANSKYQW